MTDFTQLPPEAPFETAAQSWLWATEVLRRKRLPVSSPAWRDGVCMTAAQRVTMLAEETKQRAATEMEQETHAWHGMFKQRLPKTPAERYAMAQRIQAAVQSLPEAHRAILMHWAWGDWADEARLRAALAVQEKARREGKRVRLSYRYSAQQLGGILGCSKVQAWRKLNAAMKVLEKTLVAQQIVEGNEVPVSQSPAPVRRVEVGVFKGTKVA
jgi:hypothetical protein